MVIRKRAGVALAALLALSAAGAAFPLYENTSASADESAVRVSSVALTTDNASLFLPASYEEYLPLENPSDVAFSENYIAIADGMNLYVYARENGSEYKLYTLSSGNIAKIGFHGDDLYFVVRDSDASIRFYRYDYATGNARDMGFNCSTFLIVGDTLYTATVAGSSTTFAARTLTADGAGEAQPLGELPTSTTPHLAYADGTILCCVDRLLYYPVNGSFAYNQCHNLSSEASPSLNVTSVCSDGTSLYFSSAAGLFRRGTGSDGTVTRLSDASGLSAMSFHDSALYCIDGASVREISLTDSAAAFTSYEITSASDSENRLSGAVDSARAGSLLVTADAGNSRVSVYDFQTQSYSVIACESAPTLVATDGTTIAYASGMNIYTCTYGEDAFTQAETAPSTVRGIACAYGSVYYVTATAQYGVADGETVSPIVYEYGTPTGLACDLYGTLYVAYESGDIRIFTEASFTQYDASAGSQKKSFSLPDGATSLEADFEGSLYYLADGVMYREGEVFAEIDGSSFVWSADGTAQKSVSFALGFEDDEVYFNFGNYVVKSSAGALSAISTLDEIAVETARDDAFAHHGTEELLVSVPAGTVGVFTDLATLRNSDGAYFPYSSYARSGEDRQGVLLAETGEYALVLFSEGKGEYTAELFLKDSVTKIASSEYYTENETAYTRYLTNKVSSYYAPCLDGALAGEELARGTAVSVIGFVTTAELEYALVEYSDASRATVRGYVPATYLTEISPDVSSGENYTLAYLRSSSDGVVFTNAAGEERVITERVQVRLYDNGDGTYTARLSDDVSYLAVISSDMIDDGNAEVIRIALIVILTVLALVILGVYIFLLPWEKYRKKTK